MDTNRICPGCHKPLAADVPMGLCPECLLKAGFKTGGEPGATATSGFTPPTVAELTPLFPHLELVGFLGLGGMGAVYKARQPTLDRFVALKVLAPSVANQPGFAERFNREARALARLNHPNIVAVHDFGQAGTLHYLVMEFVEGANLRQIERLGPLSPEQALAIVPQICAALQFAHQEGIVHRDIKPENILLDSKGRVKITDFGIAKILGVSSGGRALTGAGDIVGTPHYMAPEQIEKPQAVDHRADIYSLGVVFYEMLTGELPLGKFQPPSQKVHVDVRLDEVVLRALEKEPERRYQQASEVKTRVETIASTPAAGSASPRTPEAHPGAANAPVISPLPVNTIAAVPAAPAHFPPAKITAPAVGLMVAAMYKLFGAFTAMFVLRGLAHGILETILGGFGTTSVLVLFKVVPAILILFGAFQMLRLKSYAWSLAAAIISIVACSLIGLPIGIWALVVLLQQDVREAFAAVPVAPPPPSHRGRGETVATVAAATVVLLAGVAVVSLLTFQTAAAVVREGGDGQKEEVRKPIEMTEPLTGEGRLSLDNVTGRIEITGWDRNEVSIHGVIHGSDRRGVESVRIDVDAQPNHVSIHTRQPSNLTGFPYSWLWFKKRYDEQVDYTVRVPRLASLEKIETVNGQILIEGVRGDISAVTVNGRTEVKGAAKRVSLSTVNGAIMVEVVSLASNQSVSCESVNGMIEATLPANSDAEISASTLNGGIRSEFPSLQPKREFPVGSNLKGKLGNGAAIVKATTLNGPITFHRGKEIVSGAAAQQ